MSRIEAIDIVVIYFGNGTASFAAIAILVSYFGIGMEYLPK